MNKKKLLFSFSFNIAIMVLTIIGMGLAIKDTATMQTEYVYIFKYFTTLSNLFLFVASTIMFVYQILLLKKKVKLIPNWVNITKLSSVVSTTITFLVVMCFLLPLAIVQDMGFDPAFLFTNSNLIFHLLNPILGFVAFILFDNNEKSIKFPQTLFALIFVGAYEIFYTLDVFLKFMPDGQHDWYHFTIFGEAWIPLIEILFLGLAFGLSWLLWFANKKIHLFEKKTATK